ncbi:MAG TPA: SCO6880 family protein [Acidimicrobiales bacterium]|nr:SCO6880 family protein [Acidimicrobiales bacterium]
MAEADGYRFEPLVRRGLIFGLGPGQVASVACAVIGAALIVRSWPGAGGLLLAALALVAAVAACRPVAGRSVFEWVRAAGRFVTARRIRPAVPVSASARGSGDILQAAATHRRSFAGGVVVGELPAQSGDVALGVVLDSVTGSAGVVMSARGDGFCLLDRAAQERRLAAWAGVLESVSSHRSPLLRLQWCQQALPAEPDAVVEHLRARGDRSAAGFEAQWSFLQKAAEGCWRHQTLLVASVRCPSRRGQVIGNGAGTVRAQVSALRSQLLAAGIICDGVLDAASLSELLSEPDATKEHWGALQVDGLWARTYWVAEWPRSRVSPDFLSSLLTGPGRRRFSVVYKPIPPEKAARDAESSRTAEVADAQLRSQGGFLRTARQRRRSEAIEGREAELADGRGAFEFCGYVTVSDESEEALSGACSDLERAAGAARLTLRALWGQQRAAYSWTLPLGRGL